MNPSERLRFQTLYQQHLNALKRQGKADATIDGYSRAIRRITECFDLCPDQITEQHLKDYFDQLIKTHSWSTLKIDRNGLQFFYKHVLGRQWQWINIVKPPSVKRLPDILSISEVSRLIHHTHEYRYQTYLLTVYSMGLRLSEALNLRIADIDKHRMKVHIRTGKGSKDRFVTLPQRTLDQLRDYWATHRNPTLLFPKGKTPEQRYQAVAPMDRGGTQKSVKAIAKSAKIQKRVTIHNLRHCYGAHLVEAGVHLRAIQHEMGHECPKTTALYTQLTNVTQLDTDQMINQMVDRLTFTPRLDP